MGGKRWWLGAAAVGGAAVAMTATLLGTGDVPRTPVEATATRVVREDPPPPAVEPPSAVEPVPPVEPARSPGGLDELAEGIGLGVVVRDLTTGEDVVSVNPDQEFDSASLVKILIALDALADHRESDPTVAHMLATSDDDEASRMWSEGGGPRIVTTWATAIGLVGTRPPEDPDQWGATTVTAADLVRIYRFLLDDPLGAVVLKGLHGMTDRGADGFDQVFGVPAVAGDRGWAAKQGWSCCSDHRTTHSTGLVGPDNRYAVVVLTAQPVEVSAARARTRVTQVVEFVLSDR
ncbi:serine hydrolase [Umezawaea tangerina]|uniref:Beta-lactamase class A catalytic domain-containing protein n=1 Tax=Umezawaea tangerina TaxID=84725 RepID=A0A2T0TLY4_9PSEU|nr:serine hydrolase [Umezawaea tangerina]PRY46631.1 hypothetical protein CLV43_101909 [Umezawaea tangerina]